ncbi:retrovirus-related pol polyprotein from transposon TNT 1-94, partial [Tanacetum coccineum]
MALGYQNRFYLKQAQQKQQSLYNGKVLLENHDPPVVYDSEETLELAQESRLKMKQLNKEIKPANYTKINHLSGVFVSQTAKSREELYFSNTSKTANVSKSISIPNEEFSDDTTPSVARKNLNDVKNTIVTLQRVVKQKMTLEIHNWSSSAHQEIHKIVKDEIFPIVNQVDVRVQNFKIQFLKEAAKFVRDFQSFAKEADESLAKHKALELEIERLLRAIVSQDIMSIMQNPSIVDSSNLQTELESYNGMQQKIERLQAQLGDQQGKIKDTPCVSNTLDPLSQKLENESVELEINPFKPSREGKYVPNKVRASVRTNPTTVSQPHVITKKDVNSDSNVLSSTRVDNTAKTRRPQPRSNTKNDRIPSAFKSSCSKNKEVEVEEHPRNLLLSKNKKHMSSECNHVKLAIRNDKSEVVCAMCKQCLITANHDKQKPKVMNPKKVGSNERIASPKPSTPRSCLRWSPTGRLFDLKGKIIAFDESESQSDCSNGDNACFSDLQWGNILITRVYFVEGLGHNLFLVWQFCNSDLDVALRRNTCFVRNLEGVDLLKGNRTTNLYTINLHEMASASLICLMAHATSTKSWLWHQRLSHLNFDIINDLAKNDLVTGLLKFKYYKEHLCPSCEQGKSKRASHPPKLVPNSKQRLHLLHIDLCGLMRIESINGK